MIRSIIEVVVRRRCMARSWFEALNFEALNWLNFRKAICKRLPVGASPAGK
jgi:hypothetical protein